MLIVPIELLEVSETTDLPDLPRLVVMRITPEAAREPYNTVAAAPLSTLMLSISSGFISDTRLELATPEFTLLSPPPLSIGTPSMTYRG